MTDWTERSFLETLEVATSRFQQVLNEEREVV